MLGEALRNATAFSKSLTTTQCHDNRTGAAPQNAFKRVMDEATKRIEKPI